MKKTVVTILLVLPFILIYFISFAGQILSSYTHIYVERIAVLNSQGDELPVNGQIKIDKGEVYELNIKIYPELASNKKFSISNSDKSICEINPETLEVTGLEYGASRIILSSEDRHYVQCIFNIQVARDDIESIVVSETEVEVAVGKDKLIKTEILPASTLLENRNLVWTSLDPSIATVDANGLITGVSFGTTKVVVSSKHKPEIRQEIIVKVTLEFGTGVFFAHTGTNIYEVNSQTFDLKSITQVNVDGCTIADVSYKLNSIVSDSDVNTSQLSEGIITFNTQRVPVNIMVYIDLGVNEYYEDDITIWFVQK